MRTWTCVCGIFCVDTNVLLEKYRLPTDQTQNKITGLSLFTVLYAMCEGDTQLIKMV